MNNKWLELNVFLTDDAKFNELLKNLVKPVIDRLYDNGTLISWHFFKEPHLCWRLLVKSDNVDSVKELVEYHLKDNLLCKEYFYGAFCERDKEYVGEANFYGKDVWELCYKRWESGANLALQLCTEKPENSLPFHYTRDIHLFENQLGFEFSDAITICLKWTKRLMECETSGEYKDKIAVLDKLILDTWKQSKIEGI